MGAKLGHNFGITLDRLEALVAAYEGSAPDSKVLEGITRGMLNLYWTLTGRFESELTPGDDVEGVIYKGKECKVWDAARDLASDIIKRTFANFQPSEVLTFAYMLDYAASEDAHREKYEKFRTQLEFEGRDVTGLMNFSKVIIWEKGLFRSRFNRLQFLEKKHNLRLPRLSDRIVEIREVQDALELVIFGHYLKPDLIRETDNDGNNKAVYKSDAMRVISNIYGGKVEVRRDARVHMP